MPIFFQNKDIVVPGDCIATGPNYKPGVGTFREGDSIFAAVIGLLEIKNDVINVIPLEGTYIPRPNDIVIGKVIDVAIASWKVDIRAPYVATLPASNVFDRPIDPVREDPRKYLDVGDTILAKIVSFDRTHDPILTIKEKGLGKLKGGRLIIMEPTKVPRLIGRKGSMINMVKGETKCKIVIGQNGRIWISCERPEIEDIIEMIVRRIEREAHTTGLTDRIREFIKQEMGKIRRGE
ncbi:MAG: exosome complex RNA-binding protein Rrp4 [Candidatus Baldrarchaeia archaeon]